MNFESKMPTQPYSCMIYFDKLSRNYIAKLANGTVCFSSADAALTINNAMLITQGNIYLKLSEDWSLKKPLSVPSYVALEGSGWNYALNYFGDDTCINLAGDYAKVSNLKISINPNAGSANHRPNGVYAAYVSYPCVEQVCVVGDTSIESDGIDVRQSGIVFLNTTDGKILDSDFQTNRMHGICIENSTFADMRGNNCSQNRKDGIIVCFSENTTVIENNCYLNGWNGIHTYYGQFSIISDNHPYQNSRSGIASHNSAYNIIDSNYCLGNGWAGIATYEMEGSTVTNNQLRNNTWHGLFLQSHSDNNTVSLNTCVDNDRLHSGVYSGIFLVGSSRNSLSGNTVLRNGNYGVNLTASSYNVVSGTICADNTAGSICINTTDCFGNIISWNQVEEGIIYNLGSATRSYGNYDPSTDKFVGNIGEPPF